MQLQYKKKNCQCFKKNEEKHQIEFMEKYNPDNIFKNRNNSIQDNQSVHKEMSLVDYKISWYKKY